MENDNSDDWFDNYIPPIVKFILYVIFFPPAFVLMLLACLFLPLKLTNKWFGFSSGKDYESRWG